MKISFEKFNRFTSFRIVLTYAIVSMIYIYTSDHLLELVIPSVEQMALVQSIKGTVFILLTAIFLYVLIKRHTRNTAAYLQQMLKVSEESEEQLKQSEEQYLSLFNHSPLPMWIFDIETLRFLKVNEAACEFYGYTLEEYAGMTLKDIRPPEGLNQMNKWLAISIQNDRFDIPDIVLHKKKDGKLIYVKVKTTYLAFEGKQARLASAIDVTQEIEMQQQLQLSLEKLKLAGQTAKLGYWTHDLTNHRIEWSDELYHIFEVDRVTFELNLQNIQQRYHPDDQSFFDESAMDEIMTSPNIELEHRIIGRKGNVKWILERIHLVKDDTGRPIKLDGIAIDISERKVQEEAIMESNERFKLLAKATVEAIIDWDIRNNTVFWGEGFHSMFGYDLEHANIHLWENNIHPDDQDMILGRLQQSMADPTETYFNAEFRFIKADQSIAYIHHKGMFIRDANGKAIRAVAAMIDLTETMERLRRIETQNDALREIAWTQSHIVRAPLANLIGMVNVLKESTHDPEQNREFINHIALSAQKLDHIIHDIVDKAHQDRLPK